MFGSIVVGTDGSETAGEAVRQSTELAKAVGATVYLVCAFEPVGNQRLREERQQVPEDMSWMVNEREDVNATLKQAQEQIQEDGVKVEIFARQGDPADAILDVAEEQNADLIVLGPSARSRLAQRLLGTVHLGLIQRSTRPVLVVTDRGQAA